MWERKSNKNLIRRTEYTYFLSIYLFFYLSSFLSIYVSIYLYFCLKILSIYFLSRYFSIYKFSIYIYFYLYIYLSIFFSIPPFFCLSIFLLSLIYLLVRNSSIYNIFEEMHMILSTLFNICEINIQFMF